MKIFITGATGFIGSAFLRLALAEGHELVALRRTGDTRVASTHSNLTWIDGTLDDMPPEAFGGCGVLVHFAAHGVDPSTATWEACFQCNVTGSLKLWIAAINAGVTRFIICGTGAEYGRSADRFDFLPPTAPLEPVGPYGASKAAASMAAIGLALERKLELAILRPFQVYGEGESEGRFWPALRAAALCGTDFPMTAGAQIRDFVPVELVARKFLEYVEQKELQPAKPLVQNIRSGNVQSLADFAASEWKKLGGRGNLLYGALPYREGEFMRYVPG